MATLKGHTGNVNCVAFSPDGKVLASADRTATPGPNDSFFPHAPILRFWDVAAHEPIAEPQLWFDHWPGRIVDNDKHDFNAEVAGEIIDLAFAPDGKSLALAKAACQILLCDLETGEVTLLPADVREHYSSVAFGPQGRYLAATDSFSNRVDLWDLQTKQRVFSREGDGRYVAFSPDGKTLASADYRIHLWDVPSGKLKAEFRYEQQTLFGSSRGSGVSSLVFRPDGNTLVTGGHDGTLMLWDAASLADDR